MKALVLTDSYDYDYSEPYAAFLVEDEASADSLVKQWREETFVQKKWHNKHGSGLSKKKYYTIPFTVWLLQKGYQELKFESVSL